MNKILLFFIFMFGGTLLYSQNIVIDGVIFSADGKTLIKYPEDKADKEYVVPEGTEVIGKRAFSSAKYLKTLTLPFSLKEIGDYALGASNLVSIVWCTYPNIIGQYIWGFPYSNIAAFGVVDNSSNCTLIDGVLFSKDTKILLCFPPRKIDDRLSGIYEIPRGTEIIAKNAFSCANIAEVVLPSTIIRIEDCAFHVSWLISTRMNNDVRTLSKVYCNAITPPIVIGNAFLDVGCINLFVPERRFDFYHNTSYWQDFHSINGDTGINTNQVGNSFSKVWIQSDILYLKSDKEVEMVDVYDANGACIWNERINDRTWQLVTSKLSRGLLLMKVTAVNGNQETFKLSNKFLW
ncbi:MULTISPECIES: leucine-rich repeat protein [Bacteroides]|uniref:leucine-rich repeat protein n=1 Tax=Bacteroides TaxID=816 RepID=UPI0003642EFA|nr:MULTISPECIES: leucine-rich repeat domain-containing protein [Bacteroides]EOA60398.1 hypothetical protein HMPREF1214_00443 [Bacteroides sp. HPS0048]